MAIKFSALKNNNSSRVVEEITDLNITYAGKDGKDPLVVPSKLVTLESGAKGYITAERFAEMQGAFTEGADDTAILPDAWKVGSPKNGLPYGFWYNSEVLAPSQRTATVIPL